MNYRDIIEIKPGKRSGKPCIRHTRITVYDVLGWLANGMSQSEIIEDYPELTMEHIQACLAYAAEREHHQLTVNAAWSYCLMKTCLAESFPHYKIPIPAALKSHCFNCMR